MGRPDSAGEQLAYKRLAAQHATALVDTGMSLGLGSGSTAEQFVRVLAERPDAQSLRCVASSARTAALAQQLGLTIVDLDGSLDLAVDGADEIERRTLHAVKGLGGALTREKIVAAAATRFVLVGDGSKVVDRLGDRVDAPLPVEILSFGWRVTLGRLGALGEPVLRQRDSATFVTDNGNYIADLWHTDLADASSVADTLASLPGVVDHGLFLGLASIAIIAGAGGIEELTPAS